MAGVAVGHLDLADLAHKVVDLDQVLAECWFGEQKLASYTVPNLCKQFPADFLHAAISAFVFGAK